MAKILYLDYVAFLLYIMMIVAFLIRSSKSSRRKGIFTVLLTVGALATVYDICAVSLDNSGQGAVVLKYIMHIGYLILRNLTTPLFGVYITYVSDTWHTLKNKKFVSLLMWIPFSVVALITASSPITHLVFYINEYDVYTRGPLFFILYVSAVFYILSCLCQIIVHHKVLGREKWIPLVFILPSQLAAVIIQFKYPSILCEMFTTALLFLVVLLTVERPESRIDRTTGLLSSNVFYSTIQQACFSNKPVSIVFISITNFSALSSYLSFDNKKLLFTEIGKRLNDIKNSLNINPEIFTLNGGLFAVTFNNEDIPYATRYANHALEAISKEYAISKLLVSILPNACVVKLPDDTHDFETIRILINNIRKIKYSTEVLMASSLINNKDYEMMASMDKILEKAIKNDEFEVYFQPIYSVKDKRFNSAEALIRLFTKEYGFIRPDLFIPVSESNGSIHKIGLIVFEKVCQFIASDEYKRLGFDYIEVNLSTVQCSDNNLVNKISSLMERYDVKPSQINLEITETASNSNQRNMTNNIFELNRIGFSFSLDDFGTGYSNMVRIASLPLHIVKLDRSFTSLESDEDLRHILSETINLVKKMNMKIVAEGIETKEMLESFEGYQCDFIQGFYFSKPLPRNEFVKFIETYEF